MLEEEIKQLKASSTQPGETKAPHPSIRMLMHAVGRATLVLEKIEKVQSTEQGAKEDPVQAEEVPQIGVKRMRNE